MAVIKIRFFPGGPAALGEARGAQITLFIAEGRVPPRAADPIDTRRRSRDITETRRRR